MIFRKKVKDVSQTVTCSWWNSRILYWKHQKHFQNKVLGQQYSNQSQKYTFYYQEKRYSQSQVDKLFKKLNYWLKHDVIIINETENKKQHKFAFQRKNILP